MLSKNRHMTAKLFSFCALLILLSSLQIGCTPKNVETTTKEFLERDKKTIPKRNVVINIHPQPGDLVARRGMPIILSMLKENFTHTGIYLGDGLVLDYWHKGRRIMTLRDFYIIASKSTYQCVFRLNGPYRDEIIAQMLSTIDKEDVRRSKTFDPPGGFNLMSTSDNYQTAVCNEFLHEQYKYAIKCIAEKAKQSGDNAKYNALLKEYFDDKGNVKDLAVPRAVTKKMSRAKLGMLTFAMKIFGGGKEFEGERVTLPDGKKAYQLRCISPGSYMAEGSRFVVAEKHIPEYKPVPPGEKFNRTPAKKKKDKKTE